MLKVLKHLVDWYFLITFVVGKIIAKEKTLVLEDKRLKLMNLTFN